MPTYYLPNGKPLIDTYNNVFYYKGMILSNKVFPYQQNIYEYTEGNKLTSLKVGDGVKQYSDLIYVFGKPIDSSQKMCTMAVFNAFTLFVSHTYQTIFDFDSKYKPLNYTPSWTEVTAKPLLYTQSEVDAKFATQTLMLNSAITNFNAQLLSQKNDFNAQIITLNNSIATLTTELAKKLSNVAIKSGTGSGPALLGINATANVVITFATPFADSNYLTSQSLIGGASLLGSVVIAGVTAKTAASVTVVIKNNGLLAINLNALTVEVIAYKTT